MNKDQQQSACYQRSTPNCPQLLKTLNSCSLFEFKHQLVVMLYMMTFNDFTQCFVSDIAVFVLTRDVKLQPTKHSIVKLVKFSFFITCYWFHIPVNKDYQ